MTEDDRKESWLNRPTAFPTANELDITTRAIRFYEEQGMLTPTRRGQERIYSPKDRVALKLILRGKRIGFSLAECKTLIELYDPKAGNQKQLNIMLQMIAERRQQLSSSCSTSSRCS